MLHLICLSLLASEFVVAEERHVVCRSPDLEISYSFCGSSSETLFFGVEPCKLNGFSKWNGTLFWIPRRDLTFLRTVLSMWFETRKVLEVRHVLCTGEDDDFTFCGALKGETINTTLKISSEKGNYPMGEYTAIVKGYTGYSEADLFACINVTLILKKEPSYNIG